MTMPSIEVEVRAIVAHAAGRPPDLLGLDEDFTDALGLDSIDRLGLLAAVEQRLDLTIADADISDVGNLRELIGVARRFAREPRP